MDLRRGPQPPGAGAEDAPRGRRRARSGGHADRRRPVGRVAGDAAGAAAAGGVPVRLRRLGPAARRHLRRGRAPDHGARRLPRADQRRHPDQADRVLRRHGRPAENPPEPAAPGLAGGRPRQAGHQRSRPVRGGGELRRLQQRPGPRLLRLVRLRLRVHLRHRLLPVGPDGRGAADHPGAVRRRAGGDAADPGAGSARHLFAVPADQPDDRPGALHTDAGAQRRARHDRLRRRGRQPGRGAGDRRPRQAAVAPGLGGALDRARRRLRDVRQGPGRTRSVSRRG